MLTAIRERAKGLFAWLIVLAIVVPLVVTGVYSYVSGPQGTEVAIVDGTPISADAVNNAYQQQRQRLQQMFGGQLDPSMFDDRLLRREALERLINETVLRQYVEKHGYRISDATLAEIIYSQEIFHDDGKFSPTQYQTLLKANNLTPRGYEARVRAAEAINQIQAGVQGTDFATKTAISKLLSLQRQEREVAYLTVDADAFRKDTTVSDDEVQAHYKANLNAFQRPEQVRLAYLELGPEQVADQIEIGDDELKARYEQEKARFTEEGHRKVRHILLSLGQSAGQDDVAKAREQLLQWREQIMQGKTDFAALAKQHSQDPGSAQAGGDLGEVRRGDMVAEFEQAAFSLEPGQVSEPVRTQYGLHLIQVTEATPDQIKSFDQVKDALRAELADERAGNLIADLSNRLANLAYEHPDTLEPAAKELGLKIQETDWIGAQGGRSGITANSEVLEAAFSDEVLQSRRNSQPLVLDKNRHVVVRVIDHKPAETKPLEEVAGSVREQLLRQKLAARAKELANQLHERVTKGEALDALAQTEGVTVSAPGFVSRNAESVPVQVLQAAFRLQKPVEGQASVGTAELGNGDVAVVKVTAVRDGEAKDGGEQLAERMGDQLQALNAGAAMDAFIKALREEADVVIREDRL